MRPPRVWALLPLLLFHTALTYMTALTPRTYAVDNSCPRLVYEAITEAIHDLLPTAVAMGSTGKLDAVLQIIYPGITGPQKRKIICVSLASLIRPDVVIAFLLTY